MKSMTRPMQERLKKFHNNIVAKFGLQEFSYGNATTEDLWKFLSSSSRKDIKAVMNSWIRELGFPVVRVVLEPPSGGDPNNTVRCSSFTYCEMENISRF